MDKRKEANMRAKWGKLTIEESAEDTGLSVAEVERLAGIRMN